MQKLLTTLTCILLLQLTACSSSEERQANLNTPETSFLERIPVVYRQDIQQGNIVTQDMVNRLQPGMSKRQVRFLLGTPMLVDVFHQERWDYPYALTEGWGDTHRKRLSLYFDNDELVRLEGDYRPQPVAEEQSVVEDVVVSVPDYKDPDRGIITKAVESVSSVWSDDPGQKTREEIDRAAEEKPAE